MNSDKVSVIRIVRPTVPVNHSVVQSKRRQNFIERLINSLWQSKYFSIKFFAIIFAICATVGIILPLHIRITNLEQRITALERLVSTTVPLSQEVSRFYTFVNN